MLPLEVKLACETVVGSPFNSFLACPHFAMNLHPRLILYYGPRTTAQTASITIENVIGL
jgi:hypothetical protein